MDIRKLATDEALETEGVWQPIGEGAEVKVARFGNPKSARLFQRYTRPYRRQIDNGTMDPKKQEEILARVMAESVLLDWRGFHLGDEEVEYSTERAFEFLRDYRELRELVKDYAEDAEAYRQESLEDAEGN